jgi:hypothetical protein
MGDRAGSGLGAISQAAFAPAKTTASVISGVLVINVGNRAVTPNCEWTAQIFASS